MSDAVSDVFSDVTELLCHPLAEPFTTPTGRLQTCNDLGNILVLLGAGTQGFFSRSSFTLTSDEDVQVHFVNDALLNMLARRLQRDAQNKPSRFAVVTLNVLWEFSHQFPFHGTIARNSIPEPDNTKLHLSGARDYIREYFVPDTPTHIVFVGIGMTGRNGKGFPQFLNHVYGGGVQSVTIVDPCDTITSSRHTWLAKKCGMDLSTFPIHHVQKTAQQWLAPLRDMMPSFRTYTGPTQARFFSMLESSACARAHRTHDKVVRNLITWFVENNRLKYADIPRASRSGAAAAPPPLPRLPRPRPPPPPPLPRPQKVISRIDAAIAPEVLALTPKRAPEYWLNKRCARVLKFPGGILGYVDGTIERYHKGKWLLRHDDGDVEWLQEYEVVLGVQLFLVQYTVLSFNE